MIIVYRLVNKSDNKVVSFRDPETLALALYPNPLKRYLVVKTVMSKDDDAVDTLIEFGRLSADRNFEEFRMKTSEEDKIWNELAWVSNNTPRPEVPDLTPGLVVQNRQLMDEYRRKLVEWKLGRAEAQLRGLR